MIKLTMVSAIALSAVLLLPMLNTPNASATGPITMVAKEKQGSLMLMVKNPMNVSINSLKITLLDGKIISANGNGWRVSTDSANQVTLTSTKAIPPNGREIFFIQTDNINSIISWKAKERNGNIVGMDNARAVVRQTLNHMSGSEATYVWNARSVTITSDKVFYKSGEKMLISGVLEPSSKITITIYTPSGQQIVMGQQTDNNGNFKALHVLHNAESGTYIMKASEARAIAETSFKVL